MVQFPISPYNRLVWWDPISWGSDFTSVTVCWPTIRALSCLNDSFLQGVFFKLGSGVSMAPIALCNVSSISSMVIVSPKFMAMPAASPRRDLRIPSNMSSFLKVFPPMRQSHISTLCIEPHPLQVLPLNKEILGNLPGIAISPFTVTEVPFLSVVPNPEDCW